ncbi:MAG: InlB B-repeat-containing protein [Clostridia bacterium]|nr:InlB B-repeat-containing protein [Clostridia bacterium]
MRKKFLLTIFTVFTALFTVFSATSYAQSFSSSQKKQISELMYTAVDNMESEIDFTALPFDISASASNELYTIFENMVYDTPEFFFLMPSEITAYAMDDNIIKYDISKTYLCTKSERQQKMSQIEAMADELIYNLRTNLLSGSVDIEFDTALILHDYVATLATYDEASFSKKSTTGHGLDSVFIDHKSVCQGYCSAYKYLLNKCGIECVNAYNLSQEHEWSIVKINGQWYHVDVTYDSTKYLGTVLHHYFMLSDSQLQQTDAADNLPVHTTWETTTDNAVSCSSSSYSSIPYRDAKTAIAFTPDYRYYVDYAQEDYQITAHGENQPMTATGAHIVQCNKNNTVSNAEYLYLPTIWWAPSATPVYSSAVSSYPHYSRYFGGLGAYGYKLYCNTGNEIMCIDTAQAAPSAVSIFKYTSSNHYNSGVYLFGSAVFSAQIAYAEGEFKNDQLTNTSFDIKYLKLANTVTFNSNGGTSVPSQTVGLDGGKLSVPNPPTYRGYVFDGWYSDSSLTKKFDFNQNITSDMTLYAKWSVQEFQASRSGSRISVKKLSDSKASHIIVSAYNSLNKLISSSITPVGVSVNQTVDIELKNVSADYIKCYSFSKADGYKLIYSSR